MQKVKIDGKTYISISDYNADGIYRGCRECAFFDTLNCDDVSAGCDRCTDIIWAELSSPDDEEKYTVEDVIEALDAWALDSYDGSDRVAYVKDRLKNMADPEYKEYLRLKEKFEK